MYLLGSWLVRCCCSRLVFGWSEILWELTRTSGSGGLGRSRISRSLGVCLPTLMDLVGEIVRVGCSMLPSLPQVPACPY